MKYSVLVVAAGKKAALGVSYEKALASFNEEKSVLSQTISVFMADEKCSQIVIVLNPADMNKVVTSSESGKILYVKGGMTRQESVFIGLSAISEDLVLIHDGVRPWIRQSIIDRLLEGVVGEKACVLALKPTGSVRKVVDGYLVSEVSNEGLVLTQTPQAYDTSFLIQCYRKAIRDNVSFVDDAEVVSAVSDTPIKVVEGDLRNARFILKES